MKKILAPLATALTLAALPASAQEAPAAAAPAAATPTATAPAAKHARAGKHGGVKPVIGRITAKTDDSLTISGKKRDGGGEETKVAVDQATRFSRVAPGAPGDLTEGYLVAVTGERQGEQIKATGVLRLAKPEGGDQRDALRTFVALGRGAGRLLAPPAPGQKPGPATVGKVVSVQPLAIETIVGRKDDKAEKIEVATSETTRIVCLTEIKLADLAQGAGVLVLPKPAAEGAAPVAALVVEMPNAARAGKGKKK